MNSEDTGPNTTGEGQKMATNIPLVNTSTLSKLFHTTTGEIEKKLTRLGIQPVRLVKQQSGRRFMLWDEQICVKALEELQQARKAKLEGQQEARKDITTRTLTLVPSEAPDPEEPVPDIVSNRELLLEIRALRQQINTLIQTQTA